MSFGHDPNKLQIFLNRPEPNITAFNAGIPVNSTLEASRVIVLYSPNLNFVVTLDNSDSDASSTYEEDIEKGFKFSATQGVSITESIGVNAEFVVASVSVNFSITFTEEWSTTTTKKMSFTCPGRKKAFVYQGTLASQILKFDAGSGSYSWDGAASGCLTNVLITRETPPEGALPSGKVVPA